MRSSARGFTLIEVVIALAVLAFAFFGMISVVTYTTRMNLASQQRTTATRAAEKKIEQMLNTAQFDDIYNKFSLVGTTDKGLGWDIIEGLEAFTVDDPVQLQMKTGFLYKSIPGASLLVRFPLNAGGADFSEIGTGEFMGNVIYNDPDNPASGIKGYKDIDLNGNGNPADGAVPLAQIKVLPVIVEVHWKGAVGPTAGTKGHPMVSYKYTFFRKP